MTEMISIAVLLDIAALFGGMLAFTVLFAPLVFTQLPAAVAGGFLRAVFPWYYLYIVLLGGLGALGLAVLRGMATETGAMVLVALGAVYARWSLMPTINHLRDRELAGDADAAIGFKRRHRLSVIINGLQLLALAWVLVVVAW